MTDPATMRTLFMRLTHLVLLGVVFGTVFSSGILSARGVEDKAGSPRERKFQLDYSVSISGLKPGEKVQVWLPIPPSSEDQSVEVLPGKFPVMPQTNTETMHGNKMTY